MDDPIAYFSDWNKSGYGPIVGGYCNFLKNVLIGMKIPKFTTHDQISDFTVPLFAPSVPLVWQIFHHLENPLNIAKMKGNTLKFLKRIIKSFKIWFFMSFLRSIVLSQ